MPSGRIVRCVSFFAVWALIRKKSAKVPARKAEDPVKLSVWAWGHKVKVS